MKRIVNLGSLAMVVALAMTGCGKKHDTGGTVEAAAPPTAADCNRLGDKTVAQAMEMTPPGTPVDKRRVLQAMSEEAGRAIATRCRDDGWSGAAVACGLAAKNPGIECSDKLTAAQKQKMTTEIQAIFARGAAQLGVPGGPAAPAP